jgi:hypothetical protein
MKDSEIFTAAYHAVHYRRGARFSEDPDRTHCDIALALLARLALDSAAREAREAREAASGKKE